MENWKLISDTNGLYEVSDQARIRRTDKGTFLNPHLHNTSYMRVCMSIGGKIRNQYVHILVAHAFLGERPKGHDVNHKNGIKTDNRLENLEYLDRKQHEYHTRYVLKRQRAPVGELHCNALLTEKTVREIHQMYSTGNYTQNELAQRYSISLPAVNQILNGQSWKSLNLPPVPKRDYHLKGLDNPKGKVSLDMIEQIKLLHNQGRTVPEIMKLFSLGRTTVYRMINR